MLLKLTIAYDGTGFRGWARQPGERTVERVLSESLASLYRSCGPLAVAGRTDAGVHAYANVASVEVREGPPARRAALALNATLPRDIAAVAVEEAPEGFNARFSAHARSYRYRLWSSRSRSPFETNRSHWYPAPLDQGRLEACAEAILGVHDFRAFTPTDTQHTGFVRSIRDARWYERGEALEFEITADSFLRHMVRTLVGTMLECSPEELSALLRGAHRSQAGLTVPACGLYLTGVDYGASREEAAGARRIAVAPAIPQLGAG